MAELGGRLDAVIGDITTMAVEAVVNAANSTLLGGGGVDGAIHRAAGQGLLEECRKLGGCPTGEARITAGHGLPARWIIHTVGPVWRGGDRGEPGLLAACYRNCLALAAARGIRTVAFPSISTGAYGYPIESACRIAVGETARHLAASGRPEKVIFACFSRRDLECYRAALAEQEGGRGPAARAGQG